MSKSEKTGPLSVIVEAIRAKRDRKTGTGTAQEIAVEIGRAHV